PQVEADPCLRRGVGAFDLRYRRDKRADGWPRTAAGLQITLGGKLLVGVNHDRPRNAERLGERAGGWQPCSALERTAADRLAKLALKLAAETAGTASIQPHQQSEIETGQ